MPESLASRRGAHGAVAICFSMRSFSSQARGERLMSVDAAQSSQQDGYWCKCCDQATPASRNAETEISTFSEPPFNPLIKMSL
jgi:hypothetical protein